MTVKKKIQVSQLPITLRLPESVSLRASPSPLQAITVSEPTAEHSAM
jgi:hypothetical protein